MYLGLQASRLIPANVQTINGRSLSTLTPPFFRSLLPSLPHTHACLWKDVNQVLASQNEEGVRNFRKALVESKQDAATRLKKNVFQNYTEFVVISKEISKLEGDMLSFKSLLNDLRELSDGIKMIGPASESKIKVSFHPPNHLIDDFK